MGTNTTGTNQFNFNQQQFSTPSILGQNTPLDLNTGLGGFDVNKSIGLPTAQADSFKPFNYGAEFASPDTVGQFNFNTDYSSPVQSQDLTDVDQSKNSIFGDYVVPGINAASAAMNAYTGYKSLQLGRDQFDFGKQVTNRNIADRATNFNRTIKDGARNGFLAAGGYDTSTPEGQAKLDQAVSDYVAANSVSGKPIG